MLWLIKHFAVFVFGMEILAPMVSLGDMLVPSLKIINIGETGI